VPNAIARADWMIGRCVNPFWINDNRIIWPTRATGFDSNAVRPNYCFNAFSKVGATRFRRRPRA